MTLRSLRRPALTLAALAVAPLPAFAQQGGEAALVSTPAPPYADIADLVVPSSVVVDAVIRSADRIKPAEAPGLTPGAARFYVTADVLALVRGTSALPARVGWLVDVPPGPDGRYPKLKKLRVLAFARAVAGQADQLQLVAPDAQRAWTPGLDALTRTIAREAVAADAPPTATGVGNAFYSAGALPGEGETQIFLSTADDRPLALSISRRAEQPARWSVTTGEVIALDAVPPARDTLLWYRLACFLPAALPETSTAALSAEEAAQARDDYAFVIGQLGPCRPAPGPFIADGAGVSSTMAH